MIRWPRERPDDAFDADDPEHLRWVFEAAAQRADTFDIPGVTYTHTQGVVKNIIPAIPSTNAIVAAACATETLKMATMCSTGMDNYSLYVGTSGVYTHTVAYERDPECPVCSPGVRLELPRDATLDACMEAMRTAFPDKVDAPSVSVADGAHLYMRGPLEGSSEAISEEPWRNSWRGRTARPPWGGCSSSTRRRCARRFESDSSWRRSGRGTGEER